MELAWKTLKDYMEYEGKVLAPVTPRNVVKEAFAARILSDGQVWIDMLDHRNLLAHTYDEATFDKAVLAIRDRYLDALEETASLAHGAEALLKPASLEPRALQLVRAVLTRHAAVTGAILFGSRAKGTASQSSDVDLALEGIEDPLEAEAIASELDELPLPYIFDVKALTAIRHRPLREHIERVGVRIYG